MPEITYTTFHDGKVMLYGGDCMAVLDELPAESLDAVVSDPPYHLTSIVARFGGKHAAPAISNGPSGVYARASKGFMGQQWDGGDIAFQVELWRKIYRVLKPGAWVIAFSATRTYHRMVTAAEDAGFDIRDMVPWLYGSGFPKSLDIGKAINKKPDHENVIQWDGWGTALKPALEPAMLARKPSALSYAENVLKFGVGGLNINGCKIGSDILPSQIAGKAQLGTFARKDMVTPERQGRWPTNVLWDGSDAIQSVFVEQHVAVALHFFYSAKADAADRLGSKHPTIKPLDLMRYLVRLVTPKNGTVLDMFAGTGTTGEAALLEGMRAILIEREPQYQIDIANRMAFAGCNRALRQSVHQSKRDTQPSAAEQAGQQTLFDHQPIEEAI